MAKLRLSGPARADLVSIRQYSIKQFGPDVADAYYLGFLEVFGLLRRHPMAGAANPKLGKGIRCLVHRKHRIFYIVKGDEVLIIRIVHHAQDSRRALK